MPLLNERIVLESDQPESWRLYTGLVYGGRDETFLVPAGFCTDLASVPRALTWLIPRYGVYTLAAILHDYLCIEAQLGRFSRRDADGIFRRVLRELGVSFPRRWMMWAAVRAASLMSEATGKEWVQFLTVALIAVPLLAIPVTVVQLWVWAFRLIEWIGSPRHKH